MKHLALSLATLTLLAGCTEPAPPSAPGDGEGPSSTERAPLPSSSDDDADLAGPAPKKPPPPAPPPVAEDEEASGGAPADEEPADEEAAIDESEQGDEDSRPVAELGELLPGDDDLPIMQVSLVRGAPASKRFGPRDLLMDRLDATLDINATVGEVNQALEEAGARVCKTEGPRIPFSVVLCIPPQRDPAAVQRVADRLQRSRGISHAGPIIGSPPHVVGP